MESNGMVWVEMRRQLDHQTIVVDLHMGERYQLPPWLADQFVVNGMAVKVPTSEPELEAAALRSARRRG